MKTKIIYPILLLLLINSPLLPAQNNEEVSLADSQLLEEEDIAVDDDESLLENEDLEVNNGDKLSENENSKKTTSKKEKIRAIYKEYKEKSNSVSEKQRITGSQMIADFITDKLPLTLDLGAEPGEHGSSIFGSLQYNWNKNHASRLYLEYQGEKTSEDINNTFSSETISVSYDDYDWIIMTKQKQIEIDFYPYLRYFGDEDINASTPFFYVGAGAFYAFNWYSTNYSVWWDSSSVSYIGKSSYDGNYHIFGPIFLGSVKIPFFKYFNLTIESFLSPISWLKNNNRGNTYLYYFDKVENSFGTMENSTDSESYYWSTPTIKLDLSLDILTYFRLRTRASYRRLVIDKLKNTQEGDLSAAEITNQSIDWRVGTEIVFPSSNHTRKKNSHLWAGFYYEHNWTIESNSSSSVSQHSGKWIFCFGT
ncbi:MAG: hypothetical protein K5873_08715 [Treponema sp.]|nr:hypothetical protein [Treponema sp.]